MSKTQDPPSPLGAMLAEAEHLASAGGFSTADAASIGKILATGLTAIDKAAIEMATHTPENSATDSTAPWIDSTWIFEFTDSVPPEGIGWQLGDNGDYWMLRNASIILPGWLKKGTRITLSGRGQIIRNTIPSLGITVGSLNLKACAETKGLMPKKLQKSWEKSFTVSEDICAPLPYTILYLSAKGRGKTEKFRKSPKTQDQVTLGLNKLSLAVD